MQESLRDKHHLMGTKARPGAMSRTTRDGRGMDEHLRDSLRRMTHDRPSEPMVRVWPWKVGAVGAGPQQTRLSLAIASAAECTHGMCMCVCVCVQVTIEKPQFVTYWHTEHVFDNYETSPAPAPRSSRVAKLRLPQR